MFQGTFISTGVNTSLFEKGNWPKIFFYGHYKFRFYYSKNNEIYGCIIFVIHIKRPWEIE